MPKNTAIFNWSSGKDSALALYKTLKLGEYNICNLVTCVSEPLERISMHGVRTALLKSQCNSIGIPLYEIKLPEIADISTYNSVVGASMQYFVNENITTSIFGDIFLEDLRAYRENQLMQIGMKAHFPLWKQNTLELAKEFVALGFKAIITCVDSQKLNQSFAGRIFDAHLLADLPPDVDPCGENGEFHTFVFDGPIFSNSILFSKGDTVYKTYPAHGKSQVGENGFWFTDLVPA